MAKLVDILARELDRWPNGMSEVVGQGHKGYLHGYAGNGHPNCQTTRQIFTMCDDYETEKVTRAQWKAAVDAIKADKAVEWTGKCLPPVGTVCEHHKLGRSITTGDETIVKIIAHITDDNRISPVAVYMPCEGNPPYVGQGTADAFRPIRTPEQIAAEERDASIKEMTHHNDHAALQDWAAYVYDHLGYRKQK